MLSAQHHHFCRWVLPEGFSPEAARAWRFPGKMPAEIATELDALSPRQLRDVFQGIFGGSTNSNNTHWIRAKLKSALGLGSKKRSGSSTAGRKRAHSGGWETQPNRNPIHYPTSSPSPAGSPEPSPPPPSYAPNLASLAMCQLAAGPGLASPHPHPSSPSRSGSTEALNSTAHLPLTPPPQQLDACDGAAALLAAAAQVEAASAAAAAMAVAPAGPAAAVAPLFDVDTLNASLSLSLSSSSSAPTALPLEALLSNSMLQGIAPPSTAATASTEAATPAQAQDLPVSYPAAAAAAAAAADAAMAAAASQAAGSDRPGTTATGSDGNADPALASTQSLPIDPTGSPNSTSSNPWRQVFDRQLAEVKRQVALLRIVAALANAPHQSGN